MSVSRLALAKSGALKDVMTTLMLVAAAVVYSVHCLALAKSEAVKDAITTWWRRLYIPIFVAAAVVYSVHKQ